MIKGQPDHPGQVRKKSQTALKITAPTKYWYTCSNLSFQINSTLQRSTPTLVQFCPEEFQNLPVMFAIDMTANDIENDESDDQNQNKYH